MTLSALDKAIRETGIGASEAHKVVLGKAAIDVYLRLVEPALYVNPTTLEGRIGNALEPLIAELYTERTGYVLRSCGTKRHRDHDFVLATIDRLAHREDGGTHIVEIKRPTKFTAHDWGDEDHPDPSSQVPPKYLVQTAIQMAVWDLDRADLVPLIEGEDAIRVFTLHREADLERAILDSLVRFMLDCVVPRDPPAPDGSDASKAFLDKRHPRNRLDLIDATEETTALVRELVEIRSTAKKLKARDAEIANTLRARIGDHEGIRGLCTWKLSADAAETGEGRVAWKALAESFTPSPEQIASYTNAPTRTLRLSRKLTGGSTS